MLCTHFWEAKEVQKRVWGGEGWFHWVGGLQKQDWGQCQEGNAVGVWQSLIDYLNDYKSVGHEKE